MTDATTGAMPEPTTDPPPDPGPGGPADMVESTRHDLPPATADQPRSAQVEEDEVPDEIEAPEDLDEGEKEMPPGSEDPV